jgi:hypothetical protein
MSDTKITTSMTREKLGAALKPVDTDLVVVSTIVNAVRTLEGGFLSGWISTNDRRKRALTLASEYLGIE